MAPFGCSALHHGAWFAEPGRDYQMPAAGGLVKLPRGINIVVPSMKINEVLNQPSLKAQRDLAKEALDRQRMPSANS
jgi:hypothetical protein